jgi:hypothetical protein
MVLITLIIILPKQGEICPTFPLFSDFLNSMKFGTDRISILPEAFDYFRNCGCFHGLPWHKYRVGYIAYDLRQFRFLFIHIIMDDDYTLALLIEEYSLSLVSVGRPNRVFVTGCYGDNISGNLLFCEANMDLPRDFQIWRLSLNINQFDRTDLAWITICIQRQIIYCDLVLPPLVYTKKTSINYVLRTYWRMHVMLNLTRW